MKNSNPIALRKFDHTQVDTLVDLIHELAQYEKFEAIPKNHLRDNLITYGLSKKPQFIAQIAYVEDTAVGYVLYFFTFSASQGKPILYLEDLYVRPEYRRQKIATFLFQHLKTVSDQNDCIKIEWGVLKWNQSAQAFYRNMGAELLDVSYRVRLNTKTVQAIS